MTLTWPPDAATVLLFWPVLTGVISLFYNYLDGIPRVHAVLSLLVKAGLDLPGILNAIQRAITGLTPAEKEAEKPAVRAAVKARALLVTSVLALLFVGCTQLQAAIPEFTQVTNVVIADLRAGDTDVQIVNDVEAVLCPPPAAGCVTLEAASDIALDIVNDLLASGLLAKHETAATVANARGVQAALSAKRTARLNPPLPAGR